MYLTDTDGRPQGWAAAERNVGNVGNALKAVDYKTGKVKWSRPLAMGPAAARAARWGCSAPRAACSSATTAAATSSPTTRRPASRCGTRASATNTSNGPQTYLLDGRQYIVVGAGDTLYAFALQQ